MHAYENYTPYANPNDPCLEWFDVLGVYIYMDVCTLINIYIYYIHIWYHSHIHPCLSALKSPWFAVSRCTSASLARGSRAPGYRSPNVQTMCHKIHLLLSLKLTHALKINGWFIWHVLMGFCVFSRALAVSFRESISLACALSICH